MALAFYWENGPACIYVTIIKGHWPYNACFFVGFITVSVYEPLHDPFLGGIRIGTCRPCKGLSFLGTINGTVLITL